jgi:hypothetical protein
MAFLFACLFGLLFDPEDGDGMFLGNVGKLLPTTWHFHSKCRIDKWLIKRGSTLDHWRMQCKGQIITAHPLCIHSFTELHSITFKKRRLLTDISCKLTISNGSIKMMTKFHQQILICSLPISSHGKSKSTACQCQSCQVMGWCHYVLYQMFPHTDVTEIWRKVTHSLLILYMSFVFPVQWNVSQLFGILLCLTGKMELIYSINIQQDAFLKD